MSNATVNRELFASTLGRAGTLLTTSSLAVLATVRIKTRNGLMHIEATNFDYHAEYTMPAVTDGCLDLCVEPKLVGKIVQAMVGDIMVISTPEQVQRQSLLFTCGPTVAEVWGLDPAEFPYRAEQKGLSRKKEIPGEVMLQIVRELSYAAKKDDASFHKNLNSAGISFSTDGFRAAIGSTLLAEHQISMPSEIAGALPKMLNLAETATVAMRKNDDCLRLTTPDAEVDIRMGDADKRMIAAQEFLQKMMETESEPTLVARHRLMALLTTQKNFGYLKAKIDFEGPDGFLSVAPLPEANLDVLKDVETETRMAANGAPLKVAVTIQFMLDALKHIDAELVEVVVTKTDGPLLLGAAGGGGPRHLVMPVRMPKAA